MIRGVPCLFPAGTHLLIHADCLWTNWCVAVVVCSLEEGGQTALGPALLLSVAMAAQCPGSRVVICTDGLANVGLGNLDDIQSDDVYAESFAFYNTVTEMATQGGYVKRDFIFKFSWLQTC